jgi:hypothetical protein
VFSAEAGGRRHESLQLGPAWAVADDEEPYGRNSANWFEQVDAFLRGQPAHESHEHRVRATELGPDWVAATARVELLAVHPPTPKRDRANAVPGEQLRRSGRRREREIGAGVDSPKRCPHHAPAVPDVVTPQESRQVSLESADRRHVESPDSCCRSPAKNEWRGQVHDVRLELVQKFSEVHARTGNA